MFTRVMTVVSIVLALMVVFLARQNLHLKQQLAVPELPASALVAGQRIGPIQLVDAAGASQPLYFPGGDARTVLLFFTPDCPACRATIPVWRELIEPLEAPPRILGVNLALHGGNDDGELVTYGWPFPVFGVELEQSAGLRGISYVPATLILDGAGVIQFVWFGELDARQREELRRELVGG